MRPIQAVVVKRVRDSDPELLRYLSEMGIKPEAQLKVVDYSPFDNNLSVEIGGAKESVVLGLMVTSQVYVEIVENN